MYRLQNNHSRILRLCAALEHLKRFLSGRLSGHLRSGGAWHGDLAAVNGSISRFALSKRDGDMGAARTRDIKTPQNTLKLAEKKKQENNQDGSDASA